MSYQDLGGGLVIEVMRRVGLSGVRVRMGLEQKRRLLRARAAARKQGGKVSERWRDASRKATLAMLRPVLGWMVFYAAAYLGLETIDAPSGVFYLLLVLLVPVFLGVLGLVFVHSDDLDLSYPITHQNSPSERAIESQVVTVFNLAILSGEPEALKDLAAIVAFAKRHMSNSSDAFPNEAVQLLLSTLVARVTAELNPHQRSELEKVLGKYTSWQAYNEFVAAQVADSDQIIARAMLEARSVWDGGGERASM